MKWGYTEREKTISIRLSENEYQKLNNLVEKSGERFKSDFIRKIILMEEVKVKKDKDFEEINKKLDKIINQNSENINNANVDRSIVIALKIISETIGRKADTSDILEIIKNQQQYGFRYLEK